MAQLVSTQSKYTDYQQLILRVQSAYPVYQDSVVYDKNQLVWCDACKKEINLWSYWQGSLDAKIMLVGQDWGCPFDKSFSSTMAEIQNPITIYFSQILYLATELTEQAAAFKRFGQHMTVVILRNWWKSSNQR